MSELLVGDHCSCHKRPYWLKVVADAAARKHRQRAYYSYPCNCWHLTSQIVRRVFA